jgi:hypothetical protein
MEKSYRLFRMRNRTFQYTYQNQSLESLVSAVAVHYQTFVDKINLTLYGNNGVETEFNAIRCSSKLFEESAQRELSQWIRDLKSHNPGIIEILFFRKRIPALPYEAQSHGLLFPASHYQSVSTKTVHDLSSYVTNLDSQSREEQGFLSNEVNGKRSVSLPGLTESWESVIQTSSNLFSALSFGTLPPRRSPLSIPTDSRREQPEGDKIDSQNEKDITQGKWIIGGQTDGIKIWIEASAPKMVPISMGDQRPEFMRQHSDQNATEGNDLIEAQLSVYVVYGSLIWANPRFTKYR